MVHETASARTEFVEKPSEKAPVVSRLPSEKPSAVEQPPVTLASLSVNQVKALLTHLFGEIIGGELSVLVERQALDGLLLSCIDHISELADLDIHLNPLRAKVLWNRIESYKETKAVASDEPWLVRELPLTEAELSRHSMGKLTVDETLALFSHLIGPANLATI